MLGSEQGNPKMLDPQSVSIRYGLHTVAKGKSRRREEAKKNVIKYIHVKLWTETNQM